MSTAQKQFLMAVATVVVAIAVSNNLRAASGNTLVGKVLSGGFLARNG